MTRPVLVGVALVLMSVFGARTQASIVVLTSPSEPSRYVLATAAMNAETDSQAFPLNGGGSFSNNAVAAAFNDGIASAFAAQTSEVPDLIGSSMTGESSVFGSVFPGDTSVGGYSAESFFDVYFEVDLAETYLFSGRVNYDDPQSPNDGYSRIELFDVTNNVVVFSVEKGSQNTGLTTFDESFALQTGVVYRLTATALTTASEVQGPAFSFGGGDWSFNFRSESLVVVPEPSSLILATLGGLAGAFVLRAAKRKRSA